MIDQPVTRWQNHDYTVPLKFSPIVQITSFYVNLIDISFESDLGEDFVTIINNEVPTELTI